MAGSDKEAYRVSGTPYPHHDAFVGHVREVASGLYRQDRVHIQGEIGKSGVTIWSADGRQLLGGVLHPDFTQGNPSPVRVEAFRGRSIGWERAVVLAKQVVHVAMTEGFGGVARKWGAFVQGFENEVHMTDAETGKPYRLPSEHQEELQASMHETDVGRAVRVQDQAALLATDVLRRAEMFPGVFANMTGMYAGGQPQDVDLNNGKYEVYVRAMSDRLMPHFRPKDPACTTAWESFAQFHGYTGFDEMKRDVGHVGVMTFAAGHINNAVVQVREGNLWVTPLELSTSVAWMFNCQMSLVAKWMQYSGSMVQGYRVARTNERGETEYARSARDVMRRAMHTTDPTRTPETADECVAVVSEALESGIADRVARSAMIKRRRVYKGKEDQSYAVPHGHLRHRYEGGSFFDPTTARSVRLEGVSSDSTEIMAKLSGAAFYQLLQLGAYEANANGDLPREYWRYFDAVAHDHDQVQLSDAYNFGGMKDMRVQSVVMQAVEYVRYMQKRYTAQDIQEACEMALAGLQRMIDTSYMSEFDELVVRANDPAQLITQVHDYQLEQAEEIIRHDGNVLKMLPKRRKVVMMA